MTLTFVPKMVGMIFVLLYYLPWVSEIIIDYTKEVFQKIVLP